MSAAHHHDHAEHHHRPVWHYVVIIAILTAITGVELGPLFEWYNLPAELLLVMSAVKFTIVVLLFMHLWDDAKVYSQIFFLPLAGALAMVVVLMALAYGFSPSPSTDVLPLQERYWTDYSGKCASWLRSATSNRWYCASPPVDAARLAVYAKPAAGAAPAAPKIDLASMTPEQQKAELIAFGEKSFAANCSACHQPTGLGVPGAFPPLAGSDFAGFQDPSSHAKIIVNGLNGEITVNGTTYNGAMASFAQLSDLEIAAIATYERNSWGNDLGVVLPEQVAAVR